MNDIQSVDRAIARLIKAQDNINKFGGSDARFDRRQGAIKRLEKVAGSSAAHHILRSVFAKAVADGYTGN